MPVAYHMVNYRLFETISPDLSGKTFESLCREALDTKDQNSTALWARAPDRLYDLADVGKRQIFLNKAADLSSAVAGEMCLVQTSGLQALLELQASKVQLSNLTLAEIYTLNEKAAPNGTQFVRGMAYWMAIGNHLFFVKTQSMTPDLIHAYFDWLFKTRSSVMNQSSSFNLQAEFDKSQMSGDIGEIRSLRVTGRSAPQMTVSATFNTEDTKTVDTARIVRAGQYVFEQARTVTEALFGKAKADALVESLGPDEYLAVDAAVKVRGRRTVQSRAKFKEIANELADMTEAKVRVEGQDGKVSDDDAILRTRMPFDLSHEGSNLLDFDNVTDQMQTVYSRFVLDRKIVA